MTKTLHPIIHQHKLWRKLEILPGVLTWTGLLFPFVISIFSPVFAASCIIVYTMFWLFRSFKFCLNLTRSLKRVQKAEKTNWNEWINFVDCPEKIDYEIKKLSKQSDSQKIVEEYEELKKQIEVLKNHHQYKKSKEMMHALLYVTYKESWEVIEQSLESYVASDYPSTNMILVFAGEEGDKENFLAMSEKAKAKFGAKFKDFIVTVHPKNIPGEIKGKSANATFASRALKKYLDEKGIAYDNVMLSNFDADTVVNHGYFSELTYRYLVTLDRTEMAYQPTPMFHNNIWDVPMMMRIIAQGCTFWAMAESMEPDKYKSFSSRSLSFQTAVEIDFWDTSIIPDDSRQYWTAYVVYSGRHHVLPIYSPVYMDAVLSATYVKTFQSQYRQLRRWAWGVCDFPFLAINLWYNKNINFWVKIKHMTTFLRDSFFWATGPILLSVMGFIPTWVNPGFRDQVLAYNLPKMMSDLLTIASMGIVLCAIISLALVPRHPKKGLIGYLSLCLQWLLVPPVSIFLSALPALEAQTRLMLGRYLEIEFNVTEKARKEHASKHLPTRPAKLTR